MLFEIENDGNSQKIGQRYSGRSASDIGILEKHIEDFIANRPEVLFPNEQILVIGQSISYRNMADVLALDAAGNLIVIEIKRDWSDRETVGQLLEYAARYRNVSYEELNDIARKYKKWIGQELFTEFKSINDDEGFIEEDLGKKQRIIIVAPKSDENLQRIVDWLRSYGVPIEFVPFNLYTDEAGEPKIFEIEGVTDTPEATSSSGHWKHHWIFNTNETNSTGAYRKMFKENVAAIYGYDNGGNNLSGSSPGDTVLAYVNQQGILAIGKVVDGKVKSGADIFVDDAGIQLPEEYHLDVEWKVLNHGMTAREARDLGYNLPVRTVFGRLHNGTAAEIIVQELKKRNP